MIIRVIEYLSGETLNFSFRIDLKDLNLEVFNKERERAYNKRLEMKRNIISNLIPKERNNAVN